MAERDKTALVLSAGAPHSPLMAGWLYAVLEKGKAFDIIHASGAGAFIGLLYVAPKDQRRDAPRRQRPPAQTTETLQDRVERLERLLAQRREEPARSGRRPEEPTARNPVEAAKEALKGLVDMLGVADPIHAVLSASGFPIGYKTFFKPGAFTPLFQRWGQLFKLGKPGECFLAPIGKPITPVGQYYNAWIEELRRHEESRRLWDDLVDFWVAALTPTLITPFSKGLCAPLPFLEDLVDFNRLQRFPGHFCINAYNVSDGKDHMEVFDQREITASHVRAALAYPFIYPPGQIKDKFYFEGADRDPIWFGSLIEQRDRWGVKTVVLVDILGELEECLIRPPHNLWDAFEMSILTPICALANKEIRHFETVLKRQYDFEFHRVRFEIPKEHWPHITDWSHSNMSAMWKIGYDKGKDFGTTDETRRILDSLRPAAELFARPMM